MAEFTMRTSDSVYSYDAASGEENTTANIIFELENNNVSADTQGYLRKLQQGANRVRARVTLALSQTEYEETFAPMLVYPDYCVVSFDRNIPLRNETAGNFVFEDMKIKQELSGPAYEVELILVEII